ncbi:SusC/RagA family TonB-linked outer membrane protein [Sphingobacterium sp. DN00404]|uniref:SusC/RagA family TonB-linked outer membrane protein n=1 Tax=Sphingobacterium micropteri TaxID=2763501 RepID=A0ABR7YRL1_9SPHI|nr:SusC/RagA family TonB-linked outer membrane protein [Sphingobacterium micropteri]MBD1433985.1 SusC/RagA family TonB-linked outer membrane protein [Sphingobacterium micropteri]
MNKFYKQCCSLMLIMLFSVTTLFAQQTVTGRVTDANGALAGVTVAVVGATVAAQTDADGRYSIQANNGQTLRFSTVGYISRELTVSGASLNVTLQEDAGAIDEVVVTAMGISRETKALGYATTTISAKELTEAGNTNLGSALYGKAPGVQISTAPGGASSAVNLQIRGINSLNYNRQPLYVVDGVMIRNDQQGGSAGVNNTGGITNPGGQAIWSDNRIRGNGMLDINPNDIESLTILKGASATALYGSDAASGVIVITTKKGSKQRGLGIDFNYTGSVESAAFLPRLQYEYGPGYDAATNLQAGATEEGWMTNPSYPGERLLNYNAWGQFGPKYDGQDVRWWDGSIRSYSANKGNYKDIFTGGHNSNFNVSLSNQTDKLNYRLSASNMDYKAIVPGSKQNRSTFNLNSNVKLHDNLNFDVIASYVHTNTKNRPGLMGDVLGSYGGFFSGAEDVAKMRDQLYQTSDGYKFSPVGSNRPEEFPLAYRGVNLLNYFWQQQRNVYAEKEDRFISSATMNWSIIDKLKLRGRLGTDVTSRNIENKEHNEYATRFNATNSTGKYEVSKGLYSILYGDALLTYQETLSDDLEFSLSGGFQSRMENYDDQMSRTEGGLVTANWFSLTNTYAQAVTTHTRKELLKYAYFGLANFAFKNYLFVEATGRREYSSALPSESNPYHYGSVNTGFVFSDAFELPQFINFGKLRASYGVVGNDAPMYVSNIAYKQSALITGRGPVSALNVNENYGNLGLKPEMKTEVEIGLDLKFFNSRLGLDASYYKNNIKDQIMPLSNAFSTGAVTQIVNVGKISNRGWEVSLTGTPVIGENFSWNTRLNFANNKSRLEELIDGVPRLIFYDADQSSIRIEARPGEILGNIYVHPRSTNADGQFLISDEGNYIMDKSTYINAGNIMPKAIGGLSNTFNYKNFSLDFTADYRFGGQMVSTPHKYAYGAGRLESTLDYRETGIVLDGVNVNTNQQNDVRLSGAEYYMNNFYWGNDAWNEKAAVLDNNFIKLREAVISYRIPNSFSERLKLNNLRVSIIGRNLFYFYRTIKDIDPEAPVGNYWYSQGVDIGSNAATRSFGFSLNASF